MNTLNTAMILCTMFQTHDLVYNVAYVPLYYDTLLAMFWLLTYIQYTYLHYSIIATYITVSMIPFFYIFPAVGESNVMVYLPYSSRPFLPSDIYNNVLYVRGVALITSTYK
jgi:hypothetical protein